jgi:hypothetical protein
LDSSSCLSSDGTQKLLRAICSRDTHNGLNGPDKSELCPKCETLESTDREKKSELCACPEEENGVKTENR